MNPLHRVFFLLLLAGLLGPLPALSAQPNVLHPVQGQPPAPGFELKDIDDRLHRLSDYRGKVVIVNFWATWCPPCRFELPSMEKLWQATQDKDVIMLAINIGEDADT
ncbi:MAG: TlpA disulfide reductase family protein, partial [Granulosicoccaceae bacterium]